MVTYKTRLAAVGAAIALALITTAVPGAAQVGNALQRAVEQALLGNRDMRAIEVSVEGDQVTLAGRVATFWVKHEALRKTFDVPGVDTVVSELELPEGEADERLAEDVARAVQRYAHYTLWDYIGGVINAGVVTLSGSVTPDWDKADDLFERVAKLPGVQDVQSSIETLPTNQQDPRLRRAIASRLFASTHFERFRSMPNPPFHIIVHNGVVTLVGYVQGAAERIEMELIAGQTQGVLRVDSQLQTLR